MSDEEPEGLMPFGLEAPARLLYPRYTELATGKRAQITRLELGAGAELERTRYSNGSTVWQLRLPCDNTPHCGSCECSAYHYVNVPTEQVRQLKQFLGP